MKRILLSRALYPTPGRPQQEGAAEIAPWVLYFFPLSPLAVSHKLPNFASQK